jgi:hypothetical protein
VLAQEANEVCRTAERNGRSLAELLPALLRAPDPFVLPVLSVGPAPTAKEDPHGPYQAGEGLLPGRGWDLRRGGGPPMQRHRENARPPPS